MQYDYPSPDGGAPSPAGSSEPLEPLFEEASGIPVQVSSGRTRSHIQGEEVSAIRARYELGPLFSKLMGLLLLLLVLVAVRYAVPPFVEEIHYSMSRGRQRAEFEVAREGLNQMPLTQLSKAYQMVSHRVGPSVVHINVTTNGTPQSEEVLRLFGSERNPALGQGSGVIVDEAGYILTNRHVILGSDGIQVKLSDGRMVAAEVVGVDALTDLAVLKVNADKLLAAEWGDSDNLEVGALVWAVGSPFGLERSITFGILSAKNRADKAGTHHQDFLQTDAAVNPGNSGGPLVDAQGRVIGINTAIVGPSYQGISFAIPSSVARNVYERLKSSGRVVRGWLGVQLGALDLEQARQAGLSEPKGAVVMAVVDEPRRASPAQQAGLRTGDVVVRWNERLVDSPSTLSLLVAQTQVGSTVEVIVMRGGEPRTLHVTVGERPRRYN